MLRLIVYGVGVWALPFVLGVAIFPIVPPETALFDTIMSVSMAFSASIFAIFYLRNAERPNLDMGLFAGSIWAVICLVLDQPFFTFGPEMMRMPFQEYMADIGFTYFMIPIIAAGIGKARSS